ncbi:hypothetical protein WJU16_18095 [Chitinophaga pollutisoli]|uniref:Uncharacterized protein n=1 Tax=Chitinophaga pollutisoli TaxID=3133966 RepID=A0ABZ2YJL2_9BACT
MLHENIAAFLLNRNWVASDRNEKFTKYSPPRDLGLPDNYVISVPINNNHVDFSVFTRNILDILGSIYNLSLDELVLIIEQEQTIFSIRIYDENTRDGKISLSRFDEVLERIKSILLDTASFVIDKNSTSTRVPPEANRYLNLCEFIETQKGSFIAKIQLPQNELIKERELFDRQEVYSREINTRVKNVLSFVNREVLTPRLVDVTDEYLIENEELINLKLLKDIETFYLNAEIKNIDFSFTNLSESSKIESQEITRQKILNLSNFIENVSNRAVETIRLDFRGLITSLKSRDPDGTRNAITLGGSYQDLPVVASARLSSDDYKNALEAHKLKQYVNISGTAKKTRTRISFIEVDEFLIEE